MIKNAFYFTLTVLFVVKTFKFSSRDNFTFAWVKNGLIRKITLISKFMTSRPGYQTIAIHILPNISKE